MKHILTYRLKIMMRSRVTVFWSIVFPLVLMTLFGMVLKTSYSYNQFDTIPIAIVDNDAWSNDTALQTVLNKASLDKHKLFSVEVVSEKKAVQLLNDTKVDAYIVNGESIDIHMKESGYSQTITQMFFDEYLLKANMVKQLMMNGATTQQLQSMFFETIDYIDTENENHMDMTNVYFYSGLAMSAMFGGMWAVKAIIDIQANQSQKGARVSMAPTNKAVHLFSSLLLNLVSVFIILCIQFAYVYYLFDVNFGAHTPYMFLVLLVGDIAGSALGALIGSSNISKDAEAKVGILSSITMLGSFLAGMMIVQLKWIIHQYVPFLNYVNPVSMITDALYSLYYYGVNERFYFNILSLLIFSIICYAISYFALSKKQYASLGVR